MATRKYAYCQEPSKIILPLTAQRICAISSSRDKNSCHSFAKLSAWYVRKGGTPAPEQKKRRLGNGIACEQAMPRAWLGLLLC